VSGNEIKGAEKAEKGEMRGFGSLEGIKMGRSTYLT
jgi:hypothetical protein